MLLIKYKIYLFIIIIVGLFLIAIISLNFMCHKVIIKRLSTPSAPSPDGKRKRKIREIIAAE
jgi:hypothetical protein